MFWKRKNQSVDPEKVLERMQMLKSEKAQRREAGYDHAFRRLMRKIQKGNFEVDGDFIGLYEHNLAITEEALKERLEGTAFHCVKIIRTYSDSYTVWLCLNSIENPLWGNE